MIVCFSFRKILENVFFKIFTSMVLTVFLPTTTLLACSRHLVSTTEKNKTNGTMVAVEKKMREHVSVGSSKLLVKRNKKNAIVPAEKKYGNRFGSGRLRIAFFTRCNPPKNPSFFPQQVQVYHGAGYYHASFY